MKTMTYYVVRTRRRVVFTSMTNSLKVLLKAVDIWLIIRSIPVGRNNVMTLFRMGLLIVKSMNSPEFPFLSLSQKFIF